MNANDRLRPLAGSTQAAKEAVDHLRGAEQHLQKADHDQSEEQADVKRHHVLGLGTFPPPGKNKMMLQMIDRNSNGEEKLAQTGKEKCFCFADDAVIDAEVVLE
ncbi:hypothetical protein INR49_015593, partial [Caranx melampygus]